MKEKAISAIIEFLVLFLIGNFGMRRRKRKRGKNNRLYKELDEIKPLTEYSEKEELEVVKIKGNGAYRKMLYERGVKGRIKILNKGPGGKLTIRAKGVTGNRRGVGLEDLG